MEHTQNKINHINQQIIQRKYTIIIARRETSFTTLNEGNLLIIVLSYLRPDGNWRLLKIPQTQQ